MDLLASFDIDLRSTFTTTDMATKPAALNDLYLRFNKLTKIKRQQLSVVFNKLFRVLLEERLQDPSIISMDRLPLENLLKDMAKGITAEDRTGSKNAPIKDATVNTILDASNQSLIDTFLRLAAMVGYTDTQLLGINNQLSNIGLDESNNAYYELERRNPEMPEPNRRIESRAVAYVRMIQKFLTMIQTLDNQIRITQGLDEIRLANILTEIYRDARQALENARARYSEANIFDVIPITFNSILDIINNLRIFARSITTPTTLGGLDIIRPPPLPSSSPPPPPLPSSLPNMMSEDDIEVKYDGYPVRAQDEKAADVIIRELGQPGTSVAVSIRGVEVGLGTPFVVVNWSAMSIGGLRSLVRSHIIRNRVGSQELRTRRLEIASRGNFEEVSRLADDIITNPRERRGIIKKYNLPRAPNPDAIPLAPWMNDPDGPDHEPDDPDDPGWGRYTVSINGHNRTLDIRVLIALLVAIGVAVASIKKIVEAIQKGQDRNATGVIPPVRDESPTDTPTDTPIDGPTGGDNNPPNNIPPNNYPPNNIPQSPTDPMFPNRGGNTDPIYGGIGNITQRSQPFKPIGQPTLDIKMGADYIEADENMLRNSAVMELVEKYNDDATRYNELLTVKYDLEASGSTLKGAELAELNELSTSMRNQITGINQQASLVPSIGASTNSQYYGNKINTSKMTGAFVNTSGQSIGNVYTLIPKDNFTKSIGLDDDITTYNALANEYNAIATKYKGYGIAYGAEATFINSNEMVRKGYMDKMSNDPEYVKALARATAIDKQIQPIITKINSVLVNPETSVGRDIGRDVKYTDTQKSLIDKIVADKFEWDPITEQDKQALRDSPELYPNFERMMTLYNQLTKNGTKPMEIKQGDTSYNEYQKLKQQFIDIKKGGYKYSSEKTALQATDWNLVQSTSQKEYVRSKQEFLDAVARMKSAKQNGASSHQVSMLYNDLETKRLHYDASRQNYEKMADSYKHSLSGRTSYLADMTLEKLPDTAQEAEKFDRLQTLERVLMNNPDALKEYNDGVKQIVYAFGTSGGANKINQNYDFRMDMIKKISTKYNLSKEYTDATTREIDVKIPNMAEDPSTIVQFEGEGAEDVGQSTESANFIDPAECTLFMSDTRQRMEEQKRWEDFSLVQPWNGLGNPQTNPLLRHQVEEYINQYAKCDKAPKITPQQLRQLPEYKNKIIQNRGFQPNYKTDFPFIPTVQATFGREVWENEFAIPTNNFKTQKAIFSRADNDLPNNQFSTWYPSQGSVYHPDRQIDARNFDESSTPKIKTNSTRRPVFIGLGPMVEQYQSQQVSQFGGKTMNNDFGNTPQPTQPQRRPNSVFDTLDVSARRTMSMRRR
jgi:hypothetical protein